MQLANRRLRAWKVIGRFCLDSAIPGSLAALYAGWSHHNVTPTPWPLVVKDFGIAYFFLMWFVGQYSRVAKRIDDREILNQLTTEVAAVRTAVERKGGATNQQSYAQQMLAIGDPVTRELVLESRTALDAGYTRSGLLTLASAFENSLRSFAEKHEISRAAVLPVSQLINLAAPLLGESVVADMRNLWLTRHTLLHLGEKELIPLDQAGKLADAFLWILQLLNMPSE